MNDQDNYGNDVARGTGSMMMGFLAGAVIGAGIALLMAPAKGVETRRRLGDAARKLRDSAKDRVDQARGTVSDITEDAKSAFQTGRDAYSRSRQERSESPSVPTA